MFKCQKQSTFLRSNHERIKSVFSDGTCVLSTNIEKDWSKFIFPVEVLVIDPVSLLVRSVVLVIVVINWTVLCLLNKIVHIDLDGGICY